MGEKQIFLKGGVFMDLSSPLTALKGVGEKRQKVYACR